jgi:hypothetical protein
MDTSAAGPSHPPDGREECVKPQAGPPPRKRGELGYVDEEGRPEQSRNSSSSPDVVFPPRHPADRDTEQDVVADRNAQSPTQATANPSPSSETASTIDSVSASKQKGRQFFGLFKCDHTHKRPSKIAGIEVPTLMKFIFQVLIICGTVVGWVFVSRLLISMSTDGHTSGSSTIFAHVVFAVATLGQLLLLERRIFRIRAERYAYFHPGEVLPRFRNQHNRHSLPPEAIALAPWNRPPLPTYAAVLAESGRATGDVEDNEIAQQPPPAYGNTRGSTFLLSGFLPENLRSQRPLSMHSTASMLERPASYASRDDEWEVIQNADRARRVEESLARLERAGS